MAATTLGTAAAIEPSPASTQSDPVIAFDRLPHRGMRIGNNIAVSANMSQAVKAGRYGHRLVVPWTGDLQHVQFNVTSNRSNETSKSTVAGDQSHGFPASWQLGYAISAADEAGSRRGRSCATSTSPMNAEPPMTAAPAGSTNSSSVACR